MGMGDYAAQLAAQELLEKEEQINRIEGYQIEILEMLEALKQNNSITQSCDLPIETMNSFDFKLWSKAPILTVEQAAYLSVGLNPHDFENKDMHPRAKIMLDILTNTILEELLPASIYREAYLVHWGHNFIDKDVYFYESNPNKSRTDFKIRKEPDWKKSKISTDDLKQWLFKEGYTDSYVFFNQKDNAPSYLNENHPRYSAKLAAAVKVWLAMEDRKLLVSKATKTALEKWLTERYLELGLTYQDKLSQKAIDECVNVANWNNKGGATETP